MDGPHRWTCGSQTLGTVFSVGVLIIETRGGLIVATRIAGCLLAAVLLTACCAPMWGQAVANAQISGSVADASGAAVPGAKITATQTETHQTRTASSAADGAYVLPNLPVGPYQVEVQASGFSTYVQTGIRLGVSNDGNFK